MVSFSEMADYGWWFHEYLRKRGFILTIVVMISGKIKKSEGISGFSAESELYSKLPHFLPGNYQSL